ncbi:MAG: CoA-binding protein [Deltaproteobacteria bacterium]|nr:CoA-binding protein [Deltaproteobacteria bacterium]
MARHPLEEIINESDAFVLIGDSSQDRFPALSYAAYSKVGRSFHCIDLGGLTKSRGPVDDGVVYTTIDDLPEDRGDLAVIWVHPKSAAEAVQLAHRAGCRRVWFSFHTGHRDAVAKARELGMEVVEIGRCPVYYLDGDLPSTCRAHRLLIAAAFGRNKPPQLDPDAKRRELY